MITQDQANEDLYYIDKNVTSRINVVKLKR